jgi:hypothetical protein
VPIWEWMAFSTIIVSWAVFLYLLSRRHWNFVSLIAGAFHMLFAATLSFAPFRSWFDRSYLGLSLGFLRFEGRTATFPCALMLGWALAAAYVAVAQGTGRWMILVLAGDMFWALNFGGSMFFGQDAHRWKVQLGETATFTGASALFILLTFYVLPFVLSAIWSARRIRFSEK